MKKRILALSTAMLVILGAGKAYAGDTLLFTPVLFPPVGGIVECLVTNVGKKTLPQVQVSLLENSVPEETTNCSDLLSAAASGVSHTCFRISSSGKLCRVRITGGSDRSVRAVLNVMDSSGATILSVPATK